MENNTKDLLENEDLLQDPAQPQTESADATEYLGSEADQKELTALQTQVSDLKDKYMRLLADFENYKKRSVREKMDYLSTASRDALAALLPVMDDFDRANKNETFSEGVTLLYQKFQNILRQRGLEEMQSMGESFNPELHEAIQEFPVDDAKKGKIIEVAEKGYFLNDKLIRHAKVVVGK